MPVAERGYTGVVGTLYNTCLQHQLQLPPVEQSPWEQSPRSVLPWCAQTFGAAAPRLGLNRQSLTVGSENSVCYCLFCW